MSYNEQLADRIRELFPTDIVFSERKMFGGLAFLFSGHMAIAASGKGGILVRCSPGRFNKLAEETGVEIAVMRGKKMNGWLRVPSNKVRTKKQLQRWIDISIEHISTLPSKS